VFVEALIVGSTGKLEEVAVEAWKRINNLEVDILHRLDELIAVQRKLNDVVGNTLGGDRVSSPWELRKLEETRDLRELTELTELQELQEVCELCTIGFLLNNV